MLENIFYCELTSIMNEILWERIYKRANHNQMVFDQEEVSGIEAITVLKQSLKYIVIEEFIRFFVDGFLLLGIDKLPDIASFSTTGMSTKELQEVKYTGDELFDTYYYDMVEITDGWILEGMVGRDHAIRVTVELPLDTTLREEPLFEHATHIVF